MNNNNNLSYVLAGFRFLRNNRNLVPQVIIELNQLFCYTFVFICVRFDFTKVIC